MYVRDNEPNIYGENNFRDNGDGHHYRPGHRLMWMQDDSGYGMEWQDALKYCEDLTDAGHTDWRLPDAKELQSIVDYTRMPTQPIQPHRPRQARPLIRTFLISRLLQTIMEMKIGDFSGRYDA